MRAAYFPFLALILSACAGTPPEPPLAITPHTVTAADYPAESVRLHEQGATRLDYVVLTDGSVSNVRILQSSGSARLDDAAAMIVRQWRFRPAMQNGSAVSWRQIANLAFVLN